MGNPLTQDLKDIFHSMGKEYNECERENPHALESTKQGLKYGYNRLRLFAELFSRSLYARSILHQRCPTTKESLLLRKSTTRE